MDRSVYIQQYPQKLRVFRVQGQDQMKINHSKPFRRLTVACLGAGLVASSLLVAAPAFAVSLVVTANSTIPSGTSKIVGAAWGDIAPYKVNFTCGVPGCSNFVTSSTNATTVFRTVVVTTCTGVTYDTKTTVWESAGAGASASGTTVTTWTRGTSC